ncbi:hypothetical protein PG996_006427 [Apiospora saccharicola]|uniref:Uncharacterized protein n=1 Tax=Apiospora saccharicola TaxID=335842 RepID=A0ABR1VPB9_9PEZI
MRDAVLGVGDLLGQHRGIAQSGQQKYEYGMNRAIELEARACGRRNFHGEGITPSLKGTGDKIGVEKLGAKEVRRKLLSSPWREPARSAGV